MPKFSVDTLPEVFVSDSSISKAVYEAVARGKIRKLGSRLYTTNLDESPEKLVLRNWYYLVTSYYPDGLIADRTALENKPAPDGSVFLISKKKHPVDLPGISFRPRIGPGPLDSDRPFVNGVRLSSTARAYLENMRVSRARSGSISRTLSRNEIEVRLDALVRRQGEDAINRLRDEARDIASQLCLDNEFAKLNDIIGAMQGTREAEISSTAGKARAAGKPFDPNRIVLFEALFTALREGVSIERHIPQETGEYNTNISFFDAYFSNFIEGTEFTVEEAEEIVFAGAIPDERPDDAHDILGTYRIVSDKVEMKTTPSDIEEFITLLKRRHASIMEARPDKKPGTFKTRDNRAGQTLFVTPDLVIGTLEKGFDFLRGLGDPFQRAVFMMFLVSEVHPFAGGNGRVARIMMNAELIAGDQQRIIIPTAYRTDYLGALKSLSLNSYSIPLIRALDYAQRYTHAIDWSKLENARLMLHQTSAFAEGDNAHLMMPEDEDDSVQ